MRWVDEWELNLRLVMLGSDSLDHLSTASDEKRRKISFAVAHILTFVSSPPEANIHGSAGFHDTALTQPPL